ncbi:hypothetical protein [Synechococcus sp. N26]|uniref:hypothetical protein n=1 Tax=Synechococcus sp. N26 TaxID=2575513 RepID=UPI0010BD7AAC|nr:hypothetical protein [Synechococcus sp. N26]
MTALISFIPAAPWSVAEVIGRGDRDALIRFWLTAPEDLLESLWISPLGEATRAMVNQLHQEFPFTTDQRSVRDRINQQLQQGLDRPGTVQLLIAVFLVSPPGQLQIANAGRWLPSWLLPSYTELYESEVSKNTPSQAQHDLAATAPVPQVDFGEFPSTLEELIGNRIQLNRMLGLSNLYYIDPEDQEILDELMQLRRQFAAAIERCSEQKLQQLFEADLGDRYWAMVRSGVQKEPLSADDQAFKDRAVVRLTPSQGGGFDAPNATNAFLIAMLFYVPGTMKVDEADQKIPHWLLQGYQDIFARPLSTND